MFNRPTGWPGNLYLSSMFSGSISQLNSLNAEPVDRSISDYTSVCSYKLCLAESKQPELSSVIMIVSLGI
jgi:hypothetical protein